MLKLIIITLLTTTHLCFANSIEFVLNGKTYIIDDYQLENNGKRIRVNAPQVKNNSYTRCYPDRAGSGSQISQREKNGDIFNMVNQRLKKIQARTYRSPSSTKKTYKRPRRGPSAFQRLLNEFKTPKQKKRERLNYQ